MGFLDYYLKSAIREALSNTEHRLDRLENKINEPKQTEKKKADYDRKTVIIAGSSLVLSTLVALCSMVSSYKTAEQQNETQAFTFWQKYLELAASHPEMANGGDYYELHKADLSLKIKYEWFVGSALGAGEIVYDLRKGDKGWEEVVKTLIIDHGCCIRDSGFKSAHYSPKFRRLMEKTLNYEFPPTHTARSSELNQCGTP